MVGPEAPLADGIADTFCTASPKTLAYPPLRSAESSKDFQEAWSSTVLPLDAIGRSPMPLWRIVDRQGAPIASRLMAWLPARA